MTSDPRISLNNGLQWVRSEFDQSLTRARTLIEHHIENPEDMLPLQQALVELHTLRGTASMIQCMGVALVAEEMKKVLHEIMQGRIQDLPAEPKFDLIFANASIQWVDDHATLFPKLVAALAEGGQIAVQMPDNHDHITHVTADRLAASGA